MLIGRLHDWIFTPGLVPLLYLISNRGDYRQTNANFILGSQYSHHISVHPLQNYIPVCDARVVHQADAQTRMRHATSGPNF